MAGARIERALTDSLALKLSVSVSLALRRGGLHIENYRQAIKSIRGQKDIRELYGQSSSLRSQWRWLLREQIGQLVGVFRLDLEVG